MEGLSHATESRNEGVIDTGAQSACIGKAAFKDLCAVLSDVHGLKPFELLSTSKVTHGIGGSAKVLGSWNVPIALGKVPGMLTMAVLDDNSIPLLVPISLQRRLGMKLDVASNQIEWQLLRTKSQGRTLRNGHIACDMLEFPEQGWKVPEFLTVNLCEVVTDTVVISSSEFLHFNRGGSKKEVETENVDGINVEGESKSSTWSRISSQQLRTSSPSQAGQHSMHEDVDTSVVEGTCSDPLRGSSLCVEGVAASNADGGTRGVDDPIIKGNAKGRGDGDIPCCGRRNHGQGAASQRQHLEYARGNMTLNMWSHRSVAEGEPQREVVDMQRVWQEVAANRSHGSQPTARHGEDDSGQVQGSEIQRGTSRVSELGAQCAGSGDVERRASEVCYMGHTTRASTEQGLPTLAACGNGGRLGERGTRGYSGSWVGVHRLAQVVKLLEQLSPLLSGAKRMSLQSQAGGCSHTVTVGLHTRQGMGMCQHTTNPAVRDLIRWVADEAKQLGQEFTTMTINKVSAGGVVPVHVDKYNWHNSVNWTLVMGNFQGGMLWVSTPGGTDPPPVSCCTEGVHAELQGHLYKRKGRWLRIQPHAPHAVSEVTSGVRWSIVISCMGQLHKVADSLWDSLSQVGFPVSKTRAEAKVLRQHEAERMGVRADNKVLFRPWRQKPSMRIRGKNIDRLRDLVGYGFEHCVLIDENEQPCWHPTDIAWCVVWSDSWTYPGEDMSEVQRMNRSDRRKMQRNAEWIDNQGIVDGLKWSWPVFDDEEERVHELEDMREEIEPVMEEN
eukprot:6490310-Amphidinium_carterae.3